MTTCVFEPELSARRRGFGEGQASGIFASGLGASIDVVGRAGRRDLRRRGATWRAPRRAGRRHADVRRTHARRDRDHGRRARKRYVSQLEARRVVRVTSPSPSRAVTATWSASGRTSARDRRGCGRPRERHVPGAGALYPLPPPERSPPRRAPRVRARTLLRTSSNRLRGAARVRTPHLRALRRPNGRARVRHRAASAIRVAEAALQRRVDRAPLAASVVRSRAAS